MIVLVSRRDGYCCLQRIERHGESPNSPLVVGQKIVMPFAHRIDNDLASVSRQLLAGAGFFVYDEFGWLRASIPTRPGAFGDFHQTLNLVSNRRVA